MTKSPESDEKGTVYLYDDSFVLKLERNGNIHGHISFSYSWKKISRYTVDTGSLRVASKCLTGKYQVVDGVVQNKREKK